MPNKKQEFKAVSSRILEDFEDSINEYLSKGWKIHKLEFAVLHESRVSFYAFLTKES